MIVKFVVWRLTVAAAFAAFVLALGVRPATAAEPATAGQAERKPGRALPRVHTLGSAPMPSLHASVAESPRARRAAPPASVQGERTAPPSAGAQARPQDGGVLLEDGTFAGFWCY
jgi:hypothetical protein